MVRTARLILHKQGKLYRYLPGKFASHDNVAPCKKLDYDCLCLVGKGFVFK